MQLCDNAPLTLAPAFQMQIAAGHWAQFPEEKQRGGCGEHQRRVCRPMPILPSSRFCFHLTLSILLREWRLRLNLLRLLLLHALVPGLIKRPAEVAAATGAVVPVGGWVGGLPAVQLVGRERPGLESEGRESQGGSQGTRI